MREQGPADALAHPLRQDPKVLKTGFPGGLKQRIECDYFIVLDRRESFVRGNKPGRDCKLLAPLFHPKGWVTPMGLGRPGDRAKGGGRAGLGPDDSHELWMRRN